MQSSSMRDVSVGASTPANPAGGGGSSPTTSLQSYRVRPVERAEVASFIEEHHYSHTVNGVKVTCCFGLYDPSGHLVGASIFGAPATRGVAESYCPMAPLTVTELRRLVCIDDTPRNAESYFIGYMLRWLRSNTNIQVVLAYSDLNQGHSGVVYSATNFKLVGQVKGIKKLLWNGKIYYDRSLRVKYRGRFKPFSLRLRAALESGEAKWVQSMPKNIWVYRWKDVK